MPDVEIKYKCDITRKTDDILEIYHKLYTPWKIILWEEIEKKLTERDGYKSIVWIHGGYLFETSWTPYIIKNHYFDRKEIIQDMDKWAKTTNKDYLALFKTIDNKEYCLIWKEK